MVYIGMTCRTVEERWESGYQGNPHFYRAIKKYGKDAFSHEVLAENLTKEEAERLERFYISEHNSTNRKIGYNIENGGYSIGKHSEETKRKISESQKGRKFTEEHRRNLSESHKGYVPSKEWREKTSARMKGNKYTLGYHHTEETKRKMSEAHKGKRGKSVVCNFDGKTFKSVAEAASFYGLTRHKVLYNCTGKTKHLHGSELTFSYL